MKTENEICKCKHEKEDGHTANPLVKFTEKDSKCRYFNCSCKKFQPVLLESPKDTMYRKLVPQNQTPRQNLIAMLGQEITKTIT